MKYLKTFSVTLLLFLFLACDKQPYEPPANNAKAYVIGEEICKVDNNYNYWLLDLSTENNSSESGDTITYNGVVYNHAFKTINLDTALRHAGKKIDTKFNFSENDHQPTQSKNCEAPNAETYLLIDLILFQETEIQ